MASAKMIHNEKMHLFFYNGTPMAVMDDEYNHYMKNQTSCLKQLKKDMALNGIEYTVPNLKRFCTEFLDKIHAELLVVVPIGEFMNPEKKFKAWGNEVTFYEFMWVMYVHYLETICKVPSTNTFGYMSLSSESSDMMNIFTKPCDVHSCGNPECKFRYMTMKKCSGCNKQYYCSAECQKIHWKQHKKVCK